MANSQLHIGAVCSANASAIQAAFGHLKSLGVSLSVVTHQPAGIEDFCAREGVAVKRVVEPRKQAFSERAADWLLAQGADFAVLFLDRLLSAAFIDRLYTVNFHPALLPAFAGMNAVEQALAAKAPYLGATAHQAILKVDAGQILCQSVYALSPDDHNLARMNDVSFVQRLALLCNVVDSQLAVGSQSRGWQVPPRPDASHGSDFVSPCWLSESSRMLVREHARRRGMSINV